MEDLKTEREKGKIEFEEAEAWKVDRGKTNLQALVYHIHPPTSATAEYAIGLEKLSANEQFFHDAQTAVSL